MWELNSGLQILNFLYAIVLGIIFDLFYDIFKSFRLNIKFSDILVFVQDILYFFILSVLSFCFFLIFTYGEIRFYILIGFAVGFLVSRFTLSKISIPVFSFIIRVIIKFLGYLRWIFNKLYDFLYNILKKVGIFSKKTLKSVKKLLKKTEGLLYTTRE